MYFFDILMFVLYWIWVTQQAKKREYCINYVNHTKHISYLDPLQIESVPHNTGYTPENTKFNTVSDLLEGEVEIRLKNKIQYLVTFHFYLVTRQRWFF